MACCFHIPPVKTKEVPELTAAGGDREVGRGKELT